MTSRKLLNGKKVEEYEFPMVLEVFTKCPSKWKLVDLETGEEYIGVNPINRVKNKHWKKI